MSKQARFREAVNGMNVGDVVILPHSDVQHQERCRYNLIVQEENKRLQDNKYHLIHVGEEFVAIVLLPKELVGVA